MSSHRLTFRGRSFGLLGHSATSSSTSVAGQPRSPADALPPQDISSQQPDHKRKRKVVNFIVGHLVLALRVTKEISGSQPHLQLAIGALAVVLEAYKRCSSNTDAIEVLGGHIERLNITLKNVLPDDHERCPQALKARLENFARDLQSVAGDAKHLQSQWLVVRMAKASEIERKIEDCVKTASWRIQCLIVEGTIAVELVVHEMAEDTRQGFQSMNGRFNRVDEELDGVRQDMSHLGTDAIAGLRYAPNARFDYARSGRSECDTETRREVLASIWSWLMPNDPRLETLPDSLFTVPQGFSMLWVKAMAGAGKTTLAQTVAEWCAEANILGASFFCGRDGARSDVLRVVQNIASEIAFQNADFRKALCAAAKANPHIQTAHVSQQLKTLVVEPLRVATAQGSFPTNLVVIIDGLDECNDDNAMSVVLQALSLHAEDLAPLRFVITSRPVENITRGYRVLEELKRKTFEFALDEIPADIARHDTSTYMRSRLAQIKRGRVDAGFTCDPDWPSQVDFEKLVSLTDSLFIFAATAMRFIEDPQVSDPETQLASLLASAKGAKLSRSATSPLWQLDALYLESLRKAFPSMGPTLRSIVKLLLGTIAVVEEQLSPSGLEALLRLRPGTARGTLNRLQSIIYVPPVEEEPKPTRFLHLSFPDFIIDPSRCDSLDFLVNPSLQHTVIALRCLEAMGSLKQNFCEIDWNNDHLLNVEIPGLSEKIAERFSSALSYACKYWSHHLCRAEVGEDLLGALEDFCFAHLLHWLEALSLLGWVDVAIDALQSAQLHLKRSSSPATDILALLHDCERIVRTFYLPINSSFFQVYKSALVFSPTDSLVRSLHTEDVPRTVLVRIGAAKWWSDTVSSLWPGLAHALDFSPDGSLIASSAADGGSFKVSNVQTGAEVQILEDHSGRIRRIWSVSFSPTGREILAGSHDGTVAVWDVASGVCLDVRKRHSTGVRTVAWSTDGILAASGASEGIVALWKVASPEDCAVLHHDHSPYVWDVIFAHDGSLLSASEEGTCYIWDPQSRSVTRRLRHPSPVLAVAVSPDNRLVACGLKTDETVLWQKEGGQRLCSLQGPSARNVISVTFLSDTRLATACDDSTCILWEVTKSRPLKVRRSTDWDHYTVAFSPDGAHLAQHSDWSAVEILQWPADTQQEVKRKLPTPTYAMARLARYFPGRPASTLLRFISGIQEPSDASQQPVFAASITPTGEHVVVVRADRIQLLNVSSGDCERSIQMDRRFDSGIIGWSHAGDFVAFRAEVDDDTIYVCNTNTGRCITLSTGHQDVVVATLFSQDKQEIVSASKDGTIRRSRWNNHVDGRPQTSPEVLFRCDGAMTAMAVSPDKTWIVSASADYSPPDTSSPDLPAKPSNEPYGRNGIYPVLRLHKSSGGVVWIEHHERPIVSLAFSDDGTRVLAGTLLGKIFLYDLTELIDTRSDQSAPPATHPSAILENAFDSGSNLPLPQISFSPDGRAIITPRSCTPLDVAPARPLPKPVGNASSFTTYFIDGDGWLWRVHSHSAPRRICWVPSALRPMDVCGCSTWSAQGNTIACNAAGYKLVLLDMSRC